MESLANSDFFHAKQSMTNNTTIKMNNSNTKADDAQAITKQEEVRREEAESLPVYSITVKTSSLRRPKSTTFSDWRGQISRPRSSGRKSGLKIDFSPLVRPKSTPYFDIKQDKKSSDVKVNKFNLI